MKVMPVNSWFPPPSELEFGMSQAKINESKVEGLREWLIDALDGPVENSLKGLSSRSDSDAKRGYSVYYPSSYRVISLEEKPVSSKKRFASRHNRLALQRSQLRQEFKLAM